MYGTGECSAFPMITGETQSTCFEMAKDFAALWKGKDAECIDERLDEINAFTAFNGTIKSAFDMALYDLAAKKAGKPLYAYLGGGKKEMETDLTIGIDDASKMAEKAIDFVRSGVRILKIKLGKDALTDVQRVKLIRETIPPATILRVDANQGWTYDASREVLTEIAKYDIQFCEQPMRSWNDNLLPALRKQVSIPLMADESVFDHHDAKRIIADGGCDFINIKFAKSGGIAEADRIYDVCSGNNIPCMIGGMLESRMALTAFAHYASARDNIRFYDMDTCMLGHKTDPVKGGVKYNKFMVELPDTPGIGADISDDFLKDCEHAKI